jgi:glyoxylase-like metal-dependent hydrolase (beta-lactamase superfamily II)
MGRMMLRRVLAPNPSPMTAEGTNSWIVGQGRVAVVDPGPDLPAHLAAILGALAAGETVTHIVVTHAHADHSALARRLAQATDAPVLGFGLPDAGRSAVMQGLAAAGLTGGGEGVDTGFVPDLRLAEGDAIVLGGGRIEVLHTPGHFAGHLSLAAGDVLLSGDQVMGWAPSLVSPPDGDMGAYMASLRRLAARRWRQMLPGHGAPVDDPAARLAALLAHRRAREAAILAAIRDAPRTLPAIVAAVYADTPPALHPAATRNALAHLIDLAGRGLVTATPALSPGATFRTV